MCVCGGGLAWITHGGEGGAGLEHTCECATQVRGQGRGVGWGWGLGDGGGGSVPCGWVGDREGQVWLGDSGGSMAWSGWAEVE